MHSSGILNTWYTGYEDYVPITLIKLIHNACIMFNDYTGISPMYFMHWAYKFAYCGLQRIIYRVPAPILESKIMTFHDYS